MESSGLDFSVTLDSNVGFSIFYAFLILYCTESIASITGVQWGQENPSLRVHRSIETYCNDPKFSDR